MKICDSTICLFCYQLPNAIFHLKRAKHLDSYQIYLLIAIFTMRHNVFYDKKITYAKIFAV